MAASLEKLRPMRPEMEYHRHVEPHVGLLTLAIGVALMFAARLSRLGAKRAGKSLRTPPFGGRAAYETAADAWKTGAAGLTPMAHRNGAAYR